MKRLIAILLICVFALAAVACGEGSGDQSTASSLSASGNDSSAAESSAADGSNQDGSETDTANSENGDESSEAVSEVSQESSDAESSEEEKLEEPQYLTQFISWKKHFGVKEEIYDVRNTDPTSLKLSKINDSAVVDGDIAVFTADYGKNIKAGEQDYSDFAVVVFEYDHSIFSYVKKSFANVGEADESTAIPKDGYVVAIHKMHADKIRAIESAEATVAFFPHGFTVNKGLNATIKKLSKAPTADGIVNPDEYGGKVMWDIKPDNTLVSYYQFEVNNYYATAKVYAAYDENNLYVGVIVDSPNHFNNCTQDGAVSMYKYECIQLDICSVAPSSDYMRDNWDGVTNSLATDNNVVRQTGYAVNDNGETLVVTWLGAQTNGHSAVCTRDDAAGKTYYEITVPWSDIGNKEENVDAVKGNIFGLSISINSGSENSEFKNITLRDGGGIIGTVDWTKIPEITLG